MSICPDIDNCIESDIFECFKWINRCGLIDNWEHLSSLKNDLAILLLREISDGVLPLNILSVLSNREIDPKKFREFSSRPYDSQFECLTNLRLFNNLIIEHFGILESEVIEAVDIVNGRRFGELISLLSKISHSEYAKRSGIKGFPLEYHLINTENEFYNRLEELANTSEIYTRRRQISDSKELNPVEDKIYETLVQHRPVQPSTAPKSKREMCIAEIVESEKNYLDSLEVLVKGYKTQLVTILQPTELKTIFNYIEEMYRTHQAFLSKLTIATMSNRGPKLHNVFIDAHKELLIYGKYCSNLQQAQNLVHDMVKTNSAKRAQLDKCQEQSGKFRKFPLSDLLTLPMQRILKYHLLLQTLIKFTEESHEDYANLKLAHESMCSVASFVNDVKRDQEAIISIDKIQGEMTGIHLPQNKKLSDYGRRQKDGELKVWIERDQKPKQRHVFIFDKMVLLAKRKNDNYDFKSAFYLPGDIPEKTDVISKKQEKGFPFKLTVKNEAKFESLVFFTKSEDMRNQWLEAIKNAIDNQYPEGFKSNGFYFDMTTFRNSDICAVCKKLLSGIFYQGYKCRKTGISCHKKCIPKVPALFPDLKPMRLNQNNPGSPSVIPGHFDNASINTNSSHAINDMLREDSNLSNGALFQHEVTGNGDVPVNCMNTNPIQSHFNDPGMFHPVSVFGGSQQNNRNIAINNNGNPGNDIRDMFGMSPFDQTVTVQSPFVNPDSSGMSHSSSSTSFVHEPWYAGELERKDANQLLKDQKPGTFLVRISKSSVRQGELSLSLKDTEPKHMKINRTTTYVNDGPIARSETKFYIEDANKFPNLRALIDFYSNNYLNKYFNLEINNLKLTYPISLGR